MVLAGNVTCGDACCCASIVDDVPGMHGAAGVATDTVVSPAEAAEEAASAAVPAADRRVTVTESEGPQ